MQCHYCHEQHDKQLPPAAHAANKDQFIPNELRTDSCQVLLNQLPSVIWAIAYYRADMMQWFYLKTDWLKDGMGTVLLQPELKAPHSICSKGWSIRRAMYVWKDLFRTKITPHCLFEPQMPRPRNFIPLLCGRSSHGNMGNWEVLPLPLLGPGVHLDCIGLQRFFEGNDTCSHQITHWRIQLLGYTFSIIYHPAFFK